MDIYILHCEQCNGEYGEITHESAYSSLEKAQAGQAKLVTPEALKGEGAINKWQKDGDDKWIFRTGNWGYQIWSIAWLLVDEEN